MVDWVQVLNEREGTRGRISRAQFEYISRVSPGLLKEVSVDQKPYVPELFKDKTAPKEPKTKEAEVAAKDEEK